MPSKVVDWEVLTRAVVACEALEPDEFGHSEVMVADYTMGVFTVEPNTELKGVVKWMEIPE